MPAKYGREESGIRYGVYIPKVSWMLLKDFFWRLKMKYVVLSFHPLVLFYFFGIVLTPLWFLGVLYSQYYKFAQGGSLFVRGVLSLLLFILGVQSIQMENYKHRMGLKELIERGETQSLEFKESLKLKEEIGETISAFSNSDGGAVIVGVSDKNHAYRRVGKTNQMISSSELRKLAKESGERVYWDERVCEEASLEDIEKEKVKTFLKIAKEERNLRIGENIPTKEALRKLKLVKEDKLTNAGVVLFGKEPQRFFTQSEVRCARFKGDEAVKPFVDMKVYPSPLTSKIGIIFLR